MSDDLIKRQDAIDEINKSIIPHDMACASYSNLCINAVRRVPSADRPQGKWMPIIEATEFGEPYTAGIYCSECGETLGCEANYCPNCGAHMKGVDDEQ